MTKCRKFIAKGSVRNRILVPVDDKKDKKRFLTYSSKAKAEAAFKISGFYVPRDFPYDTRYTTDHTIYLEAVECNLVLDISVNN